MEWKKDKTYHFNGRNHESWINGRNHQLLVSKEGKRWIVSLEKGYKGADRLAETDTKKEAIEYAKNWMRASEQYGY